MTKAKTSVAAYFKKQYPKHPLKLLNLPCVGIGSKGAWLPMELLAVEGGAGNMVREASRPYQLSQYVT